tara:strand:+ start:11730 stop:13100 length:1371 start_codon:yes stop_codon:yes gene_type:complete
VSSGIAFGVLMVLGVTSLLSDAQAQISRSKPKPMAPQDAYLQPVAGLSYSQLRLFREGEKEFKVPWVVFPLLGGHWGLGPTFIADACSTCHINGGRGITIDDTIIVQQLLRLSVPGEGPRGGPNPHPNYGDQIQVFGVNVGVKENLKPGEAEIYVDWQALEVELADGEMVSMRKPIIRIENLNFGPIGATVMTSLRNTQAVFGMGFLEAVPEATLIRLAEDQKKQGLNGRLNRVYDDTLKKTVVGRFGWKANQPSIRQQIAVAFIGDIGVNSSLYPDENCPKVQTICRAMAPGNQPELLDYNLEQMTFWHAALAPPPTRNSGSEEVVLGERLFEQAKCSGCHLPELRTGNYPLLPLIEYQTFRAYTDLLLHDMGEDLADGRPDFLAGPRDWRTPPLWGIGLSAQVNGSTNFLHDGRARNIQEAILWHGGEAKTSRDLFADMSKDERNALIAFVNSL